MLDFIGAAIAGIWAAIAFVALLVAMQTLPAWFLLPLATMSAASWLIRRRDAPR